MKINFTNFPKEFKFLKNDLIKKFVKLGKSGEYVLGNELKIFEKKIENYLSVKHALGVGNWTEGTIMVLKALDFKENDEIITVSNSFIATCGAIAFAGCRPVLVDIKSDLNIDVDLIEKKITKKTKAIMPVHLSGIPANLNKLKKLCNKYKLFLIEDAAHAFGVNYYNQQIGTIGDVGVFSLHPRKSFHVLGDGGLIVTNNSALYKKIKLMRNHGLKNRNESEIWGTNSRLDNLQAGFGNIMLKRIKEWNKSQLNIAKYYSKNLKNLVEIPECDLKNSNPSFHQYIIRAKDRDKLQNFLKKNGIETAIHYPVPIHHQKAFIRQYGIIKLPITEFYSNKILSLPINPYLKKKEIDYIIKKIKHFYHYNKSNNEN
jgi:dTDP-4-amino-4,6-dideoxygalactose transaminase